MTRNGVKLRVHGLDIENCKDVQIGKYNKKEDLWCWGEAWPLAFSNPSEWGKWATTLIRYRQNVGVIILYISGRCRRVWLLAHTWQHVYNIHTFTLKVTKLTRSSTYWVQRAIKSPFEVISSVGQAAWCPCCPWSVYMRAYLNVRDWLCMRGGGGRTCYLYILHSAKTQQGHYMFGISEAKWLLNTEKLPDFDLNTGNLPRLPDISPWGEASHLGNGHTYPFTPVLPMTVQPEPLRTLLWPMLRRYA